MKESWRTAETWHCKRPGNAIGEGAASEVAEAPGLKGPGREDEACQHEESLGEIIGESVAQLQQETQPIGDARTTAIE